MAMNLQIVIERSVDYSSMLFTGYTTYPGIL